MGGKVQTNLSYRSRSFKQNISKSNSVIYNKDKASQPGGFIPECKVGLIFENQSL